MPVAVTSLLPTPSISSARKKIAPLSGDERHARNRRRQSGEARLDGGRGCAGVSRLADAMPAASIQRGLQCGGAGGATVSFSSARAAPGSAVNASASACKRAIGEGTRTGHGKGGSDANAKMLPF